VRDAAIASAGFRSSRQFCNRNDRASACWPEKAGGKKAAESLRPALKSGGFATILVGAGFVSDSGGFSWHRQGDCGTA
jgi:hypothetical protein